VYLGEHLIDGAASAINRLTADGVRRAYATNNASRSATEVADLLRRLGIPASADDVVTAAQVAAAKLGHQYPPGTRILVVGADALRAEIAAVGLVDTSEADSAAAVVQGYGRDVGWVQLAEACVAIRRGAQWVATNIDKTLPSPRGPLPGNGSLVAALGTALAREPDLIVGKPSPQLFQTARERVGAAKPLVVGDRLDTDIEGANRAGFDSLLVLTGVTDARALLDAEPARRPTMVSADLSGLFADTADTRIPSAGAAGGLHPIRVRSWSAAVRGEAIRLSGEGSAASALAALCAVSWLEPRRWTIEPGSAEAETVLRDLELTD